MHALERGPFGALLVGAVGVVCPDRLLASMSMRCAPSSPAVGAIKVDASNLFVLVGSVSRSARAAVEDRRARAYFARALERRVLLGALTLLIVPGADFGIDDVLFADGRPCSHRAGAPISAAAFLAIGLALICLDARGRAEPITRKYSLPSSPVSSRCSRCSATSTACARLYTLGGSRGGRRGCRGRALTAVSVSILCAGRARRDDGRLERRPGRYARAAAVTCRRILVRRQSVRS